MSNIIDKIRLSGTDYTLSATSSGGSPTVELTQAEYDALVSAGTVSADTYYIITDAQAGDLTQYWTSAQTNSAITQATSGKVNTSSVVSSVTSASTDSEIPTAKAVWNVASQGGGGGGKAISAGTNISVTTGETADTVSCTLPISASTDNKNLVIFNDFGNTFTHNNTKGNVVLGYSNNLGNLFEPSIKNIIFGNNNTLNQGFGGSNPSFNFIVGDYNTIGKSYGENVSYTALFGTYLTPKNNYEYDFGKYNNSVSASTTFGDSGNTLFSVGNGTADNARHNAFEIRQNGDIYLTSGGTDIKLQDYLGGGGGGGGMTEDDELLLATALTDLNDRKIDASEVKSNYQKKGDYVTTNALNTRLAEYETALDEQNVEEVTAYALNDLNNKFGGLKLVKITESEYAALTSKDENTLYIVVADPS